MVGLSRMLLLLLMLLECIRVMEKRVDKLYVVETTKRYVAHLVMGLLWGENTISWKDLTKARVFRIAEVLNDNDKIFAFKDEAGDLFRIFPMTWDYWTQIKKLSPSGQIAPEDHPLSTIDNLEELTDYLVNRYIQYFGR